MLSCLNQLSYRDHGNEPAGSDPAEVPGRAVARRYASLAGSPWLALARPRPQYALGDI
jgi:hypothetical protein